MKHKIRSLLNNPNAIQDLKHAAFAFLIQSAGTVTNFVFNASIARMLGADGSGVFYLALSITAIASVVGRLGLDGTVLRFVAGRYAHHDWAGIKGVYAISMRMVVVASGLISVILFFASPLIAVHLFGKPNLAEPLRWMCLSILPFAVLNIQAESLKGITRVKGAMLLQSVAPPLIALSLLYPLAMWAGIVGVVYAYVVSMVLIAALSAWVWHTALHEQRQIEPLFSRQEVWASSCSLYVVTLINGALLPWAPLFLLGIWASNAEVGIFAIATRISMPVSFMLTAIVSVVAPKFAALYAQGNLPELERTARRAVLLTLIFATPVVLVLVFGSRWVMGFFGVSFIEGAPILVVLGIAQFINAACGPVGNLLTMSGHQKWLRVGTIRSSVIQLIVALALIPMWGAMGAAIALAVSVVTNNLWAIYYIRKHLQIRYPI